MSCRIDRLDPGQDWTGSISFPDSPPRSGPETGSLVQRAYGAAVYPPDELPDSPNRSGDHVLQENTTSTSSGELVNVPLTGADKVAYAFYATAATAALVGQVWAGVTHIPWPAEGFPVALRIAVVTLAVAVIELGGVATAALADLRRRKGEQAYAYRAMSLFAALVALVFN